MSQAGPLSASSLLAAVSEFLADGGYNRIEGAREHDWGSMGARLFEDPYGIVAVVVYDTWSDLFTAWPNAQATLVEIISKHLSQSEAKAWDGYLVLLTPGMPSGDGRKAADAIRNDTSRVRKLLATGEELRSLADVERAVLPLLPLAESELEEQRSVLEMLPPLLAQKGVPEDAVRVVVEAFAEQHPLVESLHAYRKQT